jgi:hypothetical protein
VAVTLDGGFLIADTWNHEVRNVTPAKFAPPGSGVITRAAGTGPPGGNSGDGGSATDAQLNMPNGIDVTADGGFIFADLINNVVRKVAPGTVLPRVTSVSPPGGGASGRY